MSDSPATSGTAWKPRASENGHQVIRIGRKGRQWYAIGDGEPFEIDVVAVHGQWVEIDRQFRDDNGEMPAEQFPEANKCAWQFVHELSGTKDLTLAEALEFIRNITEEVLKLKDFFAVRSSEKQSSPESTELRFST